MLHVAKPSTALFSRHSPECWVLYFIAEHKVQTYLASFPGLETKNVLVCTVCRCVKISFCMGIQNVLHTFASYFSCMSVQSRNLCLFVFAHKVSISYAISMADNRTRFFKALNIHKPPQNHRYFYTSADSVYQVSLSRGLGKRVWQ